jgi:CHAD domain-containing protein
VVELGAEDKTTPAISALLERLLTKRDAAFQDLVEELDDVHERGVRVKLEALVSSTATERTAGTLGDFVRSEIRERLDRVRRRWFQAHKMASGEAFHSTRIANKRLRYAIEPFRSLLPEEVGRVYETASAFHDALGDLHDCDVLLGTARTALLGTPAADRAPLMRLVERAEDERRRHLELALTLADTLQGIEWERLEKAVAALPADESEAAESDATKKPNSGERL